MIRLLPDKKLYKCEYRGSDTIEEIPPEDIMRIVFSETIEFVDGWTLRDLMEYIHPFGEIFGDMAWCNFAAFYREMQRPNTKTDLEDVKYISLKRFGQIEDDGSVNEYIHVNGTNDISDEECRLSFERDPENAVSNSYAIEFSPINELADLPIKLDENYEITKDTHNHQEPFKIVMFKASKPYVLMDVIWAILWEIRFMGSPSDRDAMADELKDRVESVKNGTAIGRPVEDVFADIEAEIAAEGTPYKWQDLITNKPFVTKINIRPATYKWQEI